MKLYSVFLKKNSKGKIDDIIFLRDGFSWMALFFNPFWFLYHKMWKEFVAVLVIATALTFFPDFEGMALQAIFLILIAFNANYWRAENLRKKKEYDFAGMTFGKNCAQAKSNFVNDTKFSPTDFSNEIFA